MPVRSGMIAEAKELISKVEEYSPKTGLVLHDAFSKMSALGCGTRLEDKRTVSGKIGSSLDAELKRAVDNVTNLRRLGTLVEMAGTVRCGGG